MKVRKKKKAKTKMGERTLPKTILYKKATWKNGRKLSAVRLKSKIFRMGGGRHTSAAAWVNRFTIG
jgi:hypothetical protein